MRKIFLLLCLLFGAVFGGDEIVLESANAYKSVITRSNAPAAALVQTSAAIVIVPSFYRGGFILGGGGGKGVMIEKSPNGMWENISAVGIGGANIGLQAGFENNSIVLFILKEEIAKDIKSGKFTISSELAASLGDFSASTNYTNELSFTRSIYAYSSNMGIFAGGSLGGAIIGARDEVLSTSSYGFGELVKAIGE